MQNDCVLVEVWIPTAYLKKDMYLPMDVPIHLVKQMISRIVMKLTNHHYTLSSDVQIFRLETSKSFSEEKTFREYELENAEILLIL